MSQPLISIDVVPLRLNRAQRRVDVVLARREFEPSAGRLALPGVLLLGGELLDDAVHRALRDKARIMREHVRAVGDVGVFDTPGRDPRGPTLSVTKYVVLGSKFEPGEGAEAVGLADARDLPFDHDLIITRAATAVLERLWVDRVTTLALLGDMFTTRDAADAHDSLAALASRPPIVRANLVRALGRNDWLEATPDVQVHGEGRPAKVWKFV